MAAVAILQKHIPLNGQRPSTKDANKVGASTKLSIMDMIKDCIVTNSSTRRGIEGVSRPVIKKHLEDQFGLDITPTIAKEIGKVIKDGHAKGVFDLPSGLNGKVKLARPPVKVEPANYNTPKRAPLAPRIANINPNPADDVKPFPLKGNPDPAPIRKPLLQSPARKVGIHVNKENANPKLQKLLVKLEARNSPLRAKLNLHATPRKGDKAAPALFPSPLRAAKKSRPYKPKDPSVSMMVALRRPTPPGAMPRIHQGLVFGVPGNQWWFVDSLGAGAFGEVWLASSTAKVSPRMAIAVKVEWRKAPLPLLDMENLVFDAVKGCVGFPQKRFFFTDGDRVLLGMDILGTNVEQTLNQMGRTAPMKYVLRFAVQMLERLQTLHGLGWLHRDFKPDNIMSGQSSSDPDTLYLVDFGFAKRYCHPVNGTHIPMKNGKGSCGTPRYASLHVHLGRESSRRDDLESLAYCLVYLHKGRLPWQGVPEHEEKWSGTYKRKAQTTAKELCSWMPSDFADFVTYCRTLGFAETPDYQRWIKRFQTTYDVMYPVKEFKWSTPETAGRAVAPAPRLPAAAPPPPPIAALPHKKHTAPQECKCANCRV